VKSAFSLFKRLRGIQRLALMSFYLPHMEYVGSIGLVLRKLNFFIADFNFFGLFMNKKHDLSNKKIPSVIRRCRCWINLGHAYSLLLES
jgi:hypothetical protein